MHCLHTQTQLLTDSNVLSSRGLYFLFYSIVTIIIIVILIIVVIIIFLIINNPLTAGQNIYLGFYKKIKL